MEGATFMSVLCTMPGRYGDILWALPTVRMISRRLREPVDFMVADKYGSIVELIGAQDYIGRAFALKSWQVEETAPMTPRVPPEGPAFNLADYDKVFHHGYRGWPTEPLADYIWAELFPHPLSDDPHGRLDMTPWIVPNFSDVGEEPWSTVGVAFSDEWAELKMGVLLHLATTYPNMTFKLIHLHGSRYADGWAGALPPNVGRYSTPSWRLTAGMIANCTVFLGCLSAPWVLANALGIPTIIVEPEPKRHHPIFWSAHSRNHMVLGSDGKPTFDARHVANVLEQVVGRIYEGNRDGNS